MRRRLPNVNLTAPWVQFLTDNLGWIGVSLMLAIIIWIVATLDQNPIQQREFAESITVIFLTPENGDVALRPEDNIRRTARVTIRAPRSSWDELRRTDIQVFADLRNLGAGSHTIPLTGEILDSAPPGRVISVSPSEIDVTMVPVESRELDIEIQSFSELSPDYLASPLVCSHETVTVSGPGSLVSRVSRAFVQITLRNASDTSYEADIILLDEDNNEFSIRNLESLKLEPDAITCNVEITRIENGVWVLVQPDVVGSPPTGYVMGDNNWDPKQVFVVGEPDIIATLDDFVLTEPIDVTGQTSDFSRTVGVRLPEGVRILPETTRITVTVNVEPNITTRQFAEVPVQIINPDPAFVASVVPPTVSVIVTGPEPLIADLTVEDLRVTVDLRGLGEGTYTNLTANVELLRESVREVATATVQQESLSAVISIPPTPSPSPEPRPDVFGKEGE